MGLEYTDIMWQLNLLTLLIEAQVARILLEGNLAETYQIHKCIYPLIQQLASGIYHICAHM